MSVSAKAVVPAKSADYVPNALDPTQPLNGYCAIENSDIIQVRPVSMVEHEGPHIFHIPSDWLRFIEAAFMRLSGEIALADAALKAPANPATCNATICDNFGNNWINRIDVTIGNEPLAVGVGYNMAVKSNLENMLMYGVGARKTHLRASGVIEDEYDAAFTDNKSFHKFYKPQDGQTAAVEGSRTLTKLREMFRAGQYVEFSTDLHLDFARSPKSWIPGLDVYLEIHRNPDNFVIFRGDGDNVNYRYLIKNLVLSVPKVKPSLTYLHSLESKLNSSVAKFPFRNFVGNHFLLPKGQALFRSNVLFSQNVPQKTVYVLMSHKCYNGDYAHDPGVFHHYGLIKFEQLIDGLPQPLPALKWDWEKKNIAQSYRHTLDQAGFSSLDQGSFLTFDAYQRHRFMIVYNNSSLGQSAVGTGSRGRPKAGSLTVNLEFKAPLEEQLVLLCFACYDDFYTVDKKRHVYVNPPKY